MQRKLREISTKFQLFQKPANFEQRMLDCRRVLEGAKAELHILDVREVDPEEIQSRLNGCMVSSPSASPAHLGPGDSGSRGGPARRR